MRRQPGHLKTEFGSFGDGQAAYARKASFHPYTDQVQNDQERLARNPVNIATLERISKIRSRRYADLSRVLKIFNDLMDRHPQVSANDDAKDAA